MYTCNKCSKSFPTPSKLLTHQQRKTPCDKEKYDLKCEICKVNFKCLTEQQRHEKTKKHITNYNIHINGDYNNVQNGDHNLQNNLNKPLILPRFHQNLGSQLAPYLLYILFHHHHLKRVAN